MDNQTLETQDPSSVNRADTIQCSLNGCFLRFPSVEAMKKHKTKMKKNQNDDIHDFYCERCDWDCEDDVEYLIHQIQSPKHSTQLEDTSHLILTGDSRLPSMWYGIQERRW